MGNQGGQFSQFAIATGHVFAQTLTTPTMDFPYYHQDAGKGEGKETRAAYFSNGSTWTNIGEQFFDFTSVDWTPPNPQLMVGVNHGGWDMTISREGGKTWSYNTAAKLTGHIRRW